MAARHDREFRCRDARRSLNRRPARLSDGERYRRLRIARSSPSLLVAAGTVSTARIQISADIDGRGFRIVGRHWLLQRRLSLLSEFSLCLFESFGGPPGAFV